MWGAEDHVGLWGIRAIWGVGVVCDTGVCVGYRGLLGVKCEVWGTVEGRGYSPLGVEGLGVQQHLAQQGEQLQPQLWVSGRLEAVPEDSQELREHLPKGGPWKQGGLCGDPEYAWP